MALTQIVELKTETETVVMTSYAYTVKALQDQDKLHSHRNNKGLGSLAIGHYSMNGNFVVPP